ncbi:MAG: hydroxymethylbilane synthase [Litorivicinus sp.]
MLLTIATRESPLALWQAEHVKALLEAAHPDLEVALLPMTTEGDQKLEGPLYSSGGKGLFVKELEKALLDGRADLAVHSLKDVPVHFPDGLGLAGVMAGEDPRDAFVSPTYRHFDDLPAGARVGSASLRRVSQLKHARPDLEFGVVRGNLQTRLRKLDEGQFDALILAVAGLERMGLAARIAHPIDPELCLPAVGQGVLGLETRLNDTATRDRLACLMDGPTAERIAAERAVSTHLNGGCQVPLAVHAVHTPEGLRITARVGAPDGSELIEVETLGPADQGPQMGVSIAEQLLADGAGDYLE